MMSNVAFLKKLLNRFEQTLPVPAEPSKLNRSTNDADGFGAVFDEPEERDPQPVKSETEISNIDIFSLLMRCIHRGTCVVIPVNDLTTRNRCTE